MYHAEQVFSPPKRQDVSLELLLGDGKKTEKSSTKKTHPEDSLMFLVDSQES